MARLLQSIADDSPTLSYDLNAGLVSFNLRGDTNLDFSIAELRAAVVEYDRLVAGPVPEPTPTPIPDPTPSPGLPALPQARLPVDCPFIPAPPMAPTGQVITLTSDVVAYTLNASNVTVNLNGHRVGRFAIADNVKQVRVTNGDIGRIRCLPKNDPTLETLVNDLIIDNIKFVGGPNAPGNDDAEGNSIRAGRVLISNCRALAASGPAATDGFRRFCLWLDPGSHDLLLQDCDLATYGDEACVRLSSSQRTVLVRSKLTCMTQKHVYRVHGQNRLAPAAGAPITDTGPVQSVDSWISDCEFFNRGSMNATLPDNTGPQIDRIKNFYMKRIVIDMVKNGDDSASSLQFPMDGTRIDHMILDQVRVIGLRDAAQVGVMNQQLANWRRNAPNWEIGTVTFAA